MNDEEPPVAKRIACVVRMDIEAAVEELKGDDPVGLPTWEKALFSKKESDDCEGAVFKEGDLAVPVDTGVGLVGQALKGPVEIEVEDIIDESLPGSRAKKVRFGVVHY